MKISFFFATLVATALLQGCGGGGDNSGECSGSPEYCAEFSSNTGGATAGTTTSSSLAAAWTGKSGTGDADFEIPSSVKKIRIQAAAVGGFTNFIVKINGFLIVNEGLGPAEVPMDYSGEHLLVGGGNVQISFSSGAAWKFTEVP